MPVPEPTTDLSVDEIDFGGADTWDRDRRRVRQAAARAAHLVARRARDREARFEVGPGFWALTRYDDVMHVSRHPELFCSGRGRTSRLPPEELAEFLGSIINMDDPRHKKLPAARELRVRAPQLVPLLTRCTSRAPAIVDAVGRQG